MTQYTQRLGGQLDEARAQLTAVETGLRYKLMSDTVRGELEDRAQLNWRVAVLQRAYDSVAHANLVSRPVALMRHGDPSMMKSTWHDYVPALPTTTEGVTHYRRHDDWLPGTSC